MEFTNNIRRLPQLAFKGDLPETCEEAFNLKNLTIRQEIEIMEGLQDTVLGDAYTAGRKEGSMETKENDALILADYFIEESKNTLTWDEALDKAKKLLSRKVPHIPTATS